MEWVGVRLFVYSGTWLGEAAVVADCVYNEAYNLWELHSEGDTVSKMDKMVNK